jgi:hypothetical protein
MKKKTILTRNTNLVQRLDYQITFVHSNLYHSAHVRRVRFLQVPPEEIHTKNHNYSFITMTKYFILCVSLYEW